jgi:glycosyl transferase family 25
MKIFIVHYKKLVERKKYLIDNLEKYKFDYEFIDKFDRESISKFDKLYYNNEKLWQDRVNGIYNTIPDYRDLRESEICNSLSHIEALKKIVEYNLEYAIILEDDVILQDDFNEKIEDAINKIPNDLDVMFFGTSYSMSQLDNITSDKSIRVCENVWKKIPGITRTVDAYIVSNKCAKLLIEEITEIILPFDFELTYFFRKLKMNIYWYDPGFISQGSMTGVYNSSMR